MQKKHFCEVIYMHVRQQCEPPPKQVTSANRDSHFLLALDFTFHIGRHGACFFGGGARFESFNQFQK